MFRVIACWIGLGCAGIAFSAEPHVEVMRVPHGGIQPQVAAGDDGVVHMIYYSGQAASGDVYYVRSADGRTFSEPMQVNSMPGSAVAAGAMRGPQMALGRNGIVHVAWNGSAQASPDHAAMYYTRLADDRKSFEPQRDVMVNSTMLDGGGSVAADGEGGVYVVWHASPKGDNVSEQSRRLYVARSEDDGRAFVGDEPLEAVKAVGACACCGLKAAADGQGRLNIFYRSAEAVDRRPMWWLVSEDGGKSASTQLLVDDLKINHCPASTCSIVPVGSGVLLGWEAMNQARFVSQVASAPATRDASQPPGQRDRQRKYPAMARNASGQTLMAWIEARGWGKAGDLAWQVFDENGRPTGISGRKEKAPLWTTPAVFTRADGVFVVVY